MASARSDSMTEAHDTAPLRALICDDDEAVCDNLRELLESEGFIVEQASTSAETLAKAQASGDERPDVVLLDVHMDLNGVDVLKQLRDRGIETPIIMMTAVAPGATAAEAIQNGAVDYLVKPFDDLEAVARLVSRAVAYE